MPLSSADLMQDVALVHIPLGLSIHIKSSAYVENPVLAPMKMLSSYPSFAKTNPKIFDDTGWRLAH
jgi:hypothetical protein